VKAKISKELRSVLQDETGRVELIDALMHRKNGQEIKTSKKTYRLEFVCDLFSKNT